MKVSSLLSSNEFRNRSLIVLAVAVFPLFGLISSAGNNDVSLTYVLGILGLLGAIFVVKRIALYPGFLAAMVVLIQQLSFMDSKIFPHVGIPGKFHSLVFGMACLFSVYFALTQFSTLWKSLGFRALFLFFIVSTIYAVCYHSDFRSSTYIDDFIRNNPGFQHGAMATGTGSLSRQFSSDETQFIVYLMGIFPIVAYSLNYILTDIKKKVKIESLIRFLSFGYSAFAILFALSTVLGWTELSFQGARLMVGSSGILGGFEDAVLLLLFIYFRFDVPGDKQATSLADNFSLSEIGYLPAQGRKKDSIGFRLLNISLNLNITVLSLLIVCGMKKGTILAFLAAFLVFIIGNLFFNRSYLVGTIKNLLAPYRSMFKYILPTIGLLLLVLVSTPLFSRLVDNFQSRVSTNDSLDVRTTNWRFFIFYWFDSLDWFKSLFGYGIDAARESIFFITAMNPEPEYQVMHPHNYYFELFYNYGLMAFLYFGPFLIITIASITRLLSPVTDPRIKNLSLMSLGIVVCFGTYYLSESLSMLTNLFIFGVLGLLEAINILLSRHYRERVAC